MEKFQCIIVLPYLMSLLLEFKKNFHTVRSYKYFSILSKIFIVFPLTDRFTIHWQFNLDVVWDRSHHSPFYMWIYTMFQNHLLKHYISTVLHATHIIHCLFCMHIWFYWSYSYSIDLLNKEYGVVLHQCNTIIINLDLFSKILIIWLIVQLGR